jgi:ABC-type sugar transport system substrate-binding protein
MKVRRLSYGLAIAVVAAFGLSACGSSGSSGSASGEGSTTDAAGSGGAQAIGSAQAQALLDRSEVRPTSLGSELPPIGKPVPSGKKIVWVSCGVPNCVIAGEVLKEAAQTLGWTAQILETNGSASELQNAWTQAIREDPYAIVFAGTERSLIQRYLTEAEQKGILVTAATVIEPDGSPAIGEGIDFNTGSEEAVVNGPVYAAFVTANTDAEGEGVFVSIPGLPVFETTQKETENDLATMCPKCSLGTLEISLEQLGSNTPTLIVAYLRAHPDVKSVVLAADDILGIGLPAALKAAGLGDVKVTGGGASPNTLAYLESGQQESSIWTPLAENAYAMVDYLARRAAGVKPIPAKQPPAWLLTKGNIPDVQGGFPVVAELEALYATAWGK